MFVSIPLWFSLNRKMVIAFFGTSTRFHPTMVLTQRIYIWERVTVHSVSIPLWFSLNFTLCDQNIEMVCFHPTMVLTQRLHAEEIFSVILVSIPLWFSLNSRLSDRPDVVSPFPSHYGSHSTSCVQAFSPCTSCVSIPLWFSLNSPYYRKLYTITGGKVKSLRGPI